MFVCSKRSDEISTGKGGEIINTRALEMFNWRGLYFLLKRTGTIQLVCTGPKLGFIFHFFPPPFFYFAKHKQCSVTGKRRLTVFEPQVDREELENQEKNEKKRKKTQPQNSLLAKTENPQYSSPYRMALPCLSNGVTPGWNGKRTASYVPLRSSGWLPIFLQWELLAVSLSRSPFQNPKGIFKFLRVEAMAGGERELPVPPRDGTGGRSSPRRLR